MSKTGEYYAEIEMKKQAEAFRLLLQDKAYAKYEKEQRQKDEEIDFIDPTLYCVSCNAMSSKDCICKKGYEIND